MLLQALQYTPHTPQIHQHTKSPFYGNNPPEILVLLSCTGLISLLSQLNYRRNGLGIPPKLPCVKERTWSMIAKAPPTARA